MNNKNTVPMKPALLRIEQLRPFEGHPYKVQDNEEMAALSESIRENGVLSPLIVRSVENSDEYEVISGHRRLYAARKAGLTEVPVLIYTLDRDAAAIALVDSNLHREHILPSEKAYAYKLKMEALSRDDGAEGDSNSVANQKRLLQKYAKENSLGNTRFYVDDGYTGTNFNRPSFQKMIEDVEMGYVTAVIVKDMSRLGRDYLGVGYYTDTFFPEHNIRFIAVNDCVDSDDGENELAPFRNVMNEMYARDISRKVRSAHRIRGNSGEPLGQPPYGYRKDPLNKKHWIIDPEAAQVVRDIFRMCLEGKGNDTIARILQENGILNCTAYWHEKGIGRGGKKTQPNPYRWKNSTIRKILTQQEYCGDVINFKTYSKSFKDKTRIDNPEENWVIFKDVHEPIVDRDTFEQVQKKVIKRTKRRAPKSENGEKSIFSDLLYCADCGHKLWYHVNTINKNICFFSCSNYVKDYRGSCPTRHYVRADAIEQVVKLELQRMAQFLRDDEPMFADLLERKSNREIAEEKKRLEGELQKARMRTETVSRLYKKAFEKNAEGLLSDEGFLQITHEYDVEQLALKAKIPQLREQIAEAERQAANKDKFIAAIRKFMQMDELTAPLLRELIDHIEVYETQGVGKSRTQRITIHYRFVGYIDIPAAPLTSHYISETRQGVAVEYIPA